MSQYLARSIMMMMLLLLLDASRDKRHHEMCPMRSSPMKD